MRGVDVRTEAASVRLSRTQTTATASLGNSQRTLSNIWRRIGIQPATVFIALSLAFGSLIIFVTPPLRGPDEIAHFLRIYSYARGELLPAAEINGRRGIFVERELYNQLHFFRTAGEWFARTREQGVRYGQIMAVYRDDCQRGLANAPESGRILGLSPLGPSNDRWSLDGRATYLPEASEPSPSGCQGRHRIGRGFGLAPFASSPRPSILHRHFGGRSQGSC